ncbi:MAG: hypothetical protein EBS05_07890 [Proteobacteria bacterium]|nr:hypothetical protein [Pseudomonadota bacterium]
MQGARVFGDDADDVIGSALRHLHVDFERNLDDSTGLKGQVLNILLGDLVGVPSDVLGIQLNRTKSVWALRATAAWQPWCSSA